MAGLSRPTWFRFTLGHIMVLTLGVALGFLPLRLWELSQPAQPQIMLHLKVLELPRGEYEALDLGDSRGASLLSAELQAKLNALQNKPDVKVLSEPTLATCSGRMASFRMGGEIPVPKVSRAGLSSIEFEEYGTHVDLLPTLKRNGRVELEVDIRHSQPDAKPPIRNTTGITAFRTLSLQTVTELTCGETVAFGGSPNVTGAAGEPETALVIVATIERISKR